jgi:lipoprotein LpqH
MRVAVGGAGKACMNRKLVLSAAAVISVAGLLTGCGNSSSSNTAATTTTATSTDSGITIPTSIEMHKGSGTLTVDGQRVDVPDLTCTSAGGGHQIGGGDQGAENFVGITLSGDNPPKVTALGLKVGGATLGAVPGLSGDATVTVDGTKYTITGQAQGVDLKNLSGGIATKKFEVKVTCSK